MQKFLFLAVIIYVLDFMGSVAHAADLRIYGFADLVMTQTSTRYAVSSLGNKNRDINFDPESRLGLNLSADLGEQFKFAGQILARGNDRGGYDLKADWIFVTYSYNENFTVRVGRQINPIFLFSEQIDVGFTYLWVRLPHEVYGTYPVKSFNGLSVIYDTSFGDYKFQTLLLGGGGEVEVSQPNGKITGDANNTRGIEFALSKEGFKVHAAYLGSNAQGVNEVYSPASVTTIDFGTFNVFTVGALYDSASIALAGEGCRVIVENGSFVRSSTSAYGSFGYHINPKLTPYLMYSWQGSVNGLAYIYPDTSVSTTMQDSQHSAMLGVNYKATPSLALKGEYMRTQFNYDDSSQDFGANTYSISLDMIF